jgi:hypothetical protein
MAGRIFHLCSRSATHLAPVLTSIFGSGGRNGGRHASCLAPAVATLSEDDQEFFHGGIRIDLFEEYIAMFQQSFIVEEDPPVIVELGGEA